MSISSRDNRVALITVAPKRREDEFALHRTSSEITDDVVPLLGSFGVRTRPRVAFTYPAPDVIESWQFPRRAAVAGKARSRGVCLPDSSAQ